MIINYQQPILRKEQIASSPFLSIMYKKYNKPVVFLPNYGEFGPVMGKIISIVHFCNAPKKIVCCKPGEEAYYPSASYYYDWIYDLVDDEHKWGSFTKRKLVYKGREKRVNLKYGEYKQRAADDCDRIKKYFGPDYEYIPPWSFDVLDWAWTQDYSHLFRFELKPLVEKQLNVDVVISPRNKKARPDNNFDQWPIFVKALSENGFSVGLVGSKESSHLVDGYKYASWENEDNASACIELIKKCKLFVGLDTGTSHLAAFISVPMIVFQGNTPKHSSTWIIQKMNANTFLDMGCDVKVETLIEKTLGYLKNGKF